MVQEQIVIQKRENEELLIRNQKLYDSYTRMDIECNRMSEDLLASNQLLEQLRNECANLRAEKKIWEVRVIRLFRTSTLLTTSHTEHPDSLGGGGQDPRGRAFAPF